MSKNIAVASDENFYRRTLPETCIAFSRMCLHCLSLIYMYILGWRKAMSKNITVASDENFYRKTLPDTCIAFSSDTGKQIFRESLMTGQLECYFKLAAQFRTQDEPAFCGLSTLVMVLNALEVDPGQVWKGPWRWYHENMLDCCTPLEIVEQNGISFYQFICIALRNNLNVASTRVTDKISVDEFRKIVIDCTQRDDCFLVCSYSRQTLNQSGDGHFSPIGGYHPERDMVLLLDTARFKYPPHWIPLTLIFEAMKTVDEDSGQPRGFMVVRRKEIDKEQVTRTSTNHGC